MRSAAVLVVATARRLAQRFGKRKVGMVCAFIPAVLWPTSIGLKLAGLLPAEGSPQLVGVLMVFVFLGYGAVIMAGVMVGTMIADLTDEHELATSMRQEGLLFSANTFMVKAASGVGVVLAGFVLKLIGLPKGAMPETIDVQTVTNLGIAEATLLFVLGALASVFFSGYRLDREQHAAIVKELRARRLS